MPLKSKQISGPKIKAFRQIFPHLITKYADKAFEVEEAIRFINANPQLGVWCCRTKTANTSEVQKAKEKGLTPLDLQNACHCFAGRGDSCVIDSETGEKFQLLDYISKLTYRIR